MKRPPTLGTTALTWWLAIHGWNLTPRDQITLSATAASLLRIRRERDAGVRRYQESTDNLTPLAVVRYGATYGRRLAFARWLVASKRMGEGARP